MLVEVGEEELSLGRTDALTRALPRCVSLPVVARLKEYEKTGTDRLILAQYRHELRMSDIALPEATAKSLFQIICEEKVRMRPLAFDPTGGFAGRSFAKLWKAIMLSNTPKPRPI